MITLNKHEWEYRWRFDIVCPSGEQQDGYVYYCKTCKEMKGLLLPILPTDESENFVKNLICEVKNE